MNALERLQKLRKISNANKEQNNATTPSTNYDTSANEEPTQHKTKVQVCSTMETRSKESIAEKLARLKTGKGNATPERLRELTSAKEQPFNSSDKPSPEKSEVKAGGRTTLQERLALLAKKETPSDVPITVSDAKVCTTSDNNNSTSDGGLGTTDNKTVQLDKSDVSFDDLNSNQQLAVSMAGKKESFCLIGAAGSGKTTTVRSIATHLSNIGGIKKLTQGTDRVLRMGAPSIAVLSYTNQAVRNIKEALPPEFKSHCSTCHMILEYSPDFYEDFNETTFETTSKMRFIPKYGTPDYKNNYANSHCNKLPHLDIVVVEEAGSVPLDLWNIFISALPDPESTTFIFLGDLNQTPPVFDDAVLGFKLLDLPIVELDTVYRNVGLVTKLAHRILEGRPMLDKECAEWNLTDSSGTIKFMPYPKIRPWEDDLKITGSSFKKMALEGRFNPDTDVCLIPFNVKFGTIEMNKWILQGITERENKVVHHVKAGYNDHYFCVGDRVLYNKQYFYIESIEPNPDYFGAAVLPASVHMDRWGQIKPEYRDEVLGHNSDDVEVDDDLSGLLEAAGRMSVDKNEGIAKRAASHIIKLVQYNESKEIMYETKTISASSVNEMLHTAALTIHKAQGSEFQHVYCIFHSVHAVMLNRELLYTAITRSRRDLTIIYSGQTPTKIGGSVFQKGIIRQEIAGKTIKDKLKYFAAKREAEEIQRKIKAKI